MMPARRRVAAVAVAGVALVAVVGSCGSPRRSLSAWCGLVAEGAVVPLDAVEAPRHWSELENAAPDGLRDDVERLRVAAEQVAAGDPDDASGAARLVVTERVVEAHGRVVDAAATRCRIDVATLSVIDPR